MTFYLFSNPYFSSITQDRCATCIKILNEQGKIQTFFRDPISHRSRKKSDYNQDGTRFIYKLADNYAFDIITDEKFKQTTFICDNLKDFKEYKNTNPSWQKCYNACAVVPIQTRLLGTQGGGNKHHLLGFICVDNFKGGFESSEVKDLLSGYGDILYNVFVKYDKIVYTGATKGVTNERVKIYTCWNGG